MTSDLSVVIPSVNGLEILLECLTALQRQEAGAPSLEIIVIDRCGDHVRTALSSRMPDLVVIPVAGNVSIPQMRAIGFQHARGAAIAVIEDHIIVPPEWASRMLQAISAGASAVGGSVYNAATETIVDWSAFFCEYSHLMAPEGGDDVERLTGNNVTYRRELSESYSVRAFKDQWEDEIHDALRRDGICLKCAPEIAVGHKMHCRMTEYISQRYWYSRARTGSASTHMTRSSRVFGFLKSLALPPVLFARVVGNVIGSRRHQLQLAASLPLLAVFVCTWAAGEAVGYAAGPGQSLAKIR
jgi:glycosyltransferase involved in cell wall biosynthesis